MTISLISVLVLCGTCFAVDDYILNTPKCKIPKFDPYNQELVHIIKPWLYESCNKTELLTYIKKTKNSATLYIKEDLIPLYTDKDLSCCYSYVRRNGSIEEPDVGIAITPCRHFDHHVNLTHRTVKVTCNGYTANTNKIVYENVHNAVTVKKSVEKKLKKYDTVKPFSVLFVVVDSVSRLNFIRTMPETFLYLRDNYFVGMKGYTKVADNTYPNFASLITGLSWNEVQKKCKAQEVGGLDKCPMIWYDYRDKGYITAYAEDETPIGTFNYQRKGFKNPPTDYYFKPYLEATETLEIKHSADHLPYCTGPETAGERILNLAKDFATTFKDHPTFGVFWMNTFSHNDVNAPNKMDKKMKEFFVDLKTAGVLNESIVVFLSDHGVRFGNIRKTKIGWLEERMPINMISVPTRFKNMHSVEYYNLQQNANKLTTAFDMFMTLEHILILSGLSTQGKNSSGCPECTSLFKPIPENRSCEDAGIPSEWCTCFGYFQEINKTSEYVKNATDIGLKMVNAQTLKVEQESGKTCLMIFLWEVLSASISEALPYEPNTRYLFVVFEALPPGTFLMTVKFQEHITSNSTFYIRRITNLDYCVGI